MFVAEHITFLSLGKKGLLEATMPHPQQLRRKERQYKSRDLASKHSPDIFCFDSFTRNFFQISLTFLECHLAKFLQKLFNILSAFQLRNALLFKATTKQ